MSSETEYVEAKVERDNYDKLVNKYGSFQRGLDELVSQHVDKHQVVEEYLRGEGTPVFELSEEEKDELAKARGIGAKDITEATYRQGKISRGAIERALRQVYARSTVRKQVSHLRKEYETLKVGSHLRELADDDEQYQEVASRIKSKKDDEDYLEKEWFFIGDEAEKEEVERKLEELAKNSAFR
jgi:hypothetical protein